MLIFRGQVRKVFERRVLLRREQGPNFANNSSDIIDYWGPSEWWLQIGDMSIRCGSKRPPFEVSDEIELSVRKV